MELNARCWGICYFLSALVAGGWCYYIDHSMKEIAVPYTTDSDGRFISFELSKAAHSSARLRREASLEGEELNIIIPLRTGNVHMVLHPAHDLLSPSASLRFDEGNISYAAPIQYDCFYQGHVTDSEDSFAALTTCEGLSGVFQTARNEKYAIEPEQVYPGDSKSDRQPHVIRRILQEDAAAYGGIFNVKGIREKRSSGRGSSTVKHLEVMFVSDDTMIAFHGKKGVELYLLSLLNVMSLIYRHSSLGIEINVVLVKIMYLDDKMKDSILVKGDAKSSLERFCQWSSVNGVPDESDPQHYDVSVYFTRVDIGPAGYAPVTGLCRPDRSCGLIRDDGFPSAFVAAHEIGHMMGLQHDEQGNKCASDPKKGSIMAPMVMASLDGFHWSECSKNELAHVIGSLYCLNDNPFAFTWSVVPQPMGGNWNVHEQCRKEFGEGHRLCSSYTVHFSPCEMLWCSIPDNRLLCKTKKTPPLPGTSCSTGMWCYRKRCVVASSETGWGRLLSGAASAVGPATVSASVLHAARPVDGAWSTWGAWSECSRSCGRGLKSRERTCSDPEPSFGGKDCPGEGFDFKVCNVPDCEKKIDDAKADQCSARNKKGKVLVPFEPDDERLHCRRNCITKDRKEILLSESDADDGTFCSYEDRHSMCFGGTCLKIGCDGVFGSKAKDDECGVCNGKGTSCTQKHKYFSQALPRGYHKVIRLSNGTRSILVKKPYETFYLSLMNRATREIILTANGQQEATKNFVDAGTLWRYVNGNEETLRTQGPLLVDYDLMVYALYNGEKPHVTVTYNQPYGTHTIDVDEDADMKDFTTSTIKSSNYSLQNSSFGAYSHLSLSPTQVSLTTSETGVTDPDIGLSSRAAGNDWVYEKWTDCSKSCGGGFTEVVYVCRNRFSKRNVSPIYCDLSRKPRQDKRSCNKQDCVHYRWVGQMWQPCTETCGGGGKSTRTAHCLKTLSSTVDGNDSTAGGESAVRRRETRVQDSYCAGQPRLELHRACGEQPCPGHWQVSPWQPCSATCGFGVQMRQASCEPHSITAKDVRVTCLHTEMPEMQQNCSSFECETRILDPLSIAEDLNDSIGTDSISNIVADEPVNIPFTGADIENSLAVPYMAALESSSSDVSADFGLDLPPNTDEASNSRLATVQHVNTSASVALLARSKDDDPTNQEGEPGQGPAMAPVAPPVSSPIAPEDGQCEADKSRMCRTIAADRCELLLFQFVCCKTCRRRQ